MVFTRILVFVIALAMGYGVLKYTYPIVKMFGHNDLAEKYLGQGGTYTMWKLLGIIFISVGFLYLIGAIDLFPSGGNVTNDQEVEVIQ